MSRAEPGEQTIQIKCREKDCKWAPEREYFNRARALNDVRTHVEHTHHMVGVLTTVNYYWQEEL